MNSDGVPSLLHPVNSDERLDYLRQATTSPMGPLRPPLRGRREDAEDEDVEDVEDEEEDAWRW